MKNALINKSLTALLIILSLTGLAIADDNLSIAVSCSIPAVPGLNAPPLTPNAEETGSSSKQDTEVKTVQDGSLIKEDKEEKIVLADGSASRVTTTIYSR